MKCREVSPKKNPKRSFGFFCSLTVLLFALTVPALAQGTTPTADEVNRVAKGLYCPVCENVPLDVCPTQACIQWRATIRQKLAQGWSDEQIQEYFAQQYGDRVLAAPPARGLNWLIYLLPPLAVLTGAWMVLRVMRTAARPASAPAPPPDSEYATRLETELAKRK